MAEKRILIAPSKYVQYAGAINELKTYSTILGNKLYAIVDPFIEAHYKERILASFSEGDISIGGFGGESSYLEINKHKEVVTKGGYNVVAGIGGGKTLDTAKAVGFYLNIPMISIPTTASSDAPTSALSIIYTPDGQFEKYLFLRQNPNIVVVDTAIIAEAPVRTLVAGIGDALATYYEARAVHKSRKKTMAGGQCGPSALALATACRDTLFADGYKAKLAVEQKTISIALENIIEANTLLSGLGFESGGLAAAHAVHDGLTALHQTHEYLHGEKVSFGTVVQLVLENAPEEEIQTVISFCKKVGLPTSLKQLGVETFTLEEIKKVAEIACSPDDTIHNCPFVVTPDAVVSAILVADKLGSD